MEDSIDARSVERVFLLVERLPVGGDSGVADGCYTLLSHKSAYDIKVRHVFLDNL